MYRLFVALRPPPPTRAALHAIMGDPATARWQDDEQLHLTLRFIGEVGPHLADDVAGALSALDAHAPPIAFDGVGRFARQGRTHSLYAGVVPDAALLLLQRKVDTALRAAGCDLDSRRYMPHVTLARLSRGAAAEHDVERWMAEHRGLTAPPFEAPHIILYESRLGRAGARYHAVERWPLRRPLRDDQPG